MSNSLKVPLLFIGTSKKPRIFSSIPINYINQQHSWMDGPGFSYYIGKIFAPAVGDKKVLLILDNFSGHPRTLPKNKYKNIELLYLPHNTTSHLQPLDQGIIQLLKANYMSIVSLKRLETVDAYNYMNNIPKGIAGGKPNIAYGLLFSTKAFDEMPSSTVINCWIKSSLPAEWQESKIKKILPTINSYSEVTKLLPSIKPITINNNVIPSSTFYNNSLDDIILKIDIIDDELDNNNNNENREDTSRITEKKIRKQIHDLYSLTSQLKDDCKRIKINQYIEDILNEL